MITKHTDEVSFHFDRSTDHTVQMAIVADTLDQLNLTGKLPSIKDIKTISPPKEKNEPGCYWRNVSFANELDFLSVLSIPASKETLERGLKVHRSRDLENRTVIVSAEPPTKMEQVFIHFSAHLGKIGSTCCFAIGALAESSPSVLGISCGVLAVATGLYAIHSVGNSVRNWKRPEGLSDS